MKRQRKSAVSRNVCKKPWGREVLWTTPGASLVGKLIFVKAGARLSLQYHEIKSETLCLLRGQAELWLDDAAGRLRRHRMRPEVGYHVAPGRRHRLIGLSDAVIVEVSDGERGKTVRLDDDYGRPDETDALRRRPNRGWRPPLSKSY